MGGGPVVYDDVPDYVRNQHYIKYPLHLRPKAKEEEKKAPPAPTTEPKTRFEQDRPDRSGSGASPTSSMDEYNKNGLMRSVRFYKVDLAWIDCRDVNAPTDHCGDPSELRKARQKAVPPAKKEEPKPTETETPKKKG